MKPLVLAALLAGCVPIGNGSQDSGGAGCPAIGCGPAYQIDFARPGPWASGTYRVEVMADGATSSCDIVIPMSCDHPPRCQGNPGWLPALVGCALDPSQQRIEGVVFNQSTPATVTVAVSQSDRSLGMRTFTPAYRTSALAAGCSLTCTQAPGEVMTLAQ